MVYIDRNGRVLEKRPWDLYRLKEIFIAIWLFIMHFFTALIGPFRAENRGARNNGSGGFGYGGGGGGGGSSGGNGRLGPNRRIGRITNSMDCNIPCGGCSR